MATRREERILCVQALYCWQLTECPIEQVLEFGWENNRQDDEAHSFATSTVTGVVAHCGKIDTAIEKYAKHWSIDRLAQVDLATLRLGVYELFYTDMPASIVIDECVEIAKKYSNEHSPSFVNAVLDAIAKQELATPTI